jgi:HPt (histidine-containing phosphotransfer) domain-containing protein
VGRLADLVDLAHTLRSSSALLGAGRLAALAGELEQLAWTADLDRARRTLGAFENECRLVEQALRSWRPH